MNHLLDHLRPSSLVLQGFGADEYYDMRVRVHIGNAVPSVGGAVVEDPDLLTTFHLPALHLLVNLRFFEHLQTFTVDLVQE